MQLNLWSYVDISTVHISRKDDETLEEDMKWTMGYTAWEAMPHLRLIAYPTGTGYFVHTQRAEDDDAMKAMESRYTKELLNLVRQAHEQNAVFLRFDADGEVYDDIPKFDW